MTAEQRLAVARAAHESRPSDWNLAHLEAAESAYVRDESAKISSVMGTDRKDRTAA